MAGRYILTPARRAALKKAQAKSAAKRRGRGQYRRANKQAAKQINANARRGAYLAKGGALKKTGDALLGNPRRRAIAEYDRAKNNNAVKYKGKKKLSNKQLKRRRRAKTAAVVGAYVGVNLGTQALARKVNQSEYEKVSKARAKGNKKRYKQNKKQSLKARKRNFKNAGLNNRGESRRSRKPVKVTSQRLPGQTMIGSKR